MQFWAMGDNDTKSKDGVVSKDEKTARCFEEIPDWLALKLKSLADGFTENWRETQWRKYWKWKEVF